MTGHAWTPPLEQFVLRSRIVEPGCPFRTARRPGELLWSPRTCHSLHIRAGRAWISSHGEVLTLRTSEILCLELDPHGASVSAEGRPLFLEIV